MKYGFFVGCLIVALGLSAALPPAAGAQEETPSFSLAWSEYPSWSTFGVSHAFRDIDGAEGKLGPIEKKWGVDIVLEEADYDSCMVLYGSANCDAVCITNMDALNPALTRPSVAIMPTSTSDGADALIVTDDITKAEDLKGVPVYGLSKSVSEYCFVRNIEMLGLKEKDFDFINMDPGAAALAMQQKQDGYTGIVVWNPFVMETLNRRDDAHVLFDSTTIPGEIIDMVVMAADSLGKPKGKEFACAVIDAYYQITKRMADPEERDETLIAIGEKFSNLDLESMQTVVTQTKFYNTPEKGLALFTGEELPKTMVKVVDFCVSHEIVPRKPSIAYGPAKEGEKVALRFDPSYIERYVAQEKSE